MIRRPALPASHYHQIGATDVFIELPKHIALSFELQQAAYCSHRRMLQIRKINTNKFREVVVVSYSLRAMHHQ